MIDLLYDIWVFDAFQKSYFTDCSRRDSIIIPINSYFFHGYYLLGQLVCGLENHSISTFTKLLLHIILFQLIFFFAEPILWLLLLLLLNILRLFYHVFCGGVFICALLFEL